MPERAISGNKLDYWSIQVGISRYLINIYNDEWIVEINDYSPLVKKIMDSVRKVNMTRLKTFYLKIKFMNYHLR